MRRGFTLVELVLVIMVLTILAILVVPIASGLRETPTGLKSDRQIVTEATMRSIREVFVGSGQRTGLWADLGHVPNRLPRTIGQLFLSDPPLAETPLFQPEIGLGWRGPYFHRPTGIYPDVRSEHSMTGNTWEEDNFATAYGEEGDGAWIDAWGNPIVLRIESDSDGEIDRTRLREARIVSAGPDGKIDLSENGDDVVFYLGLAN